MNSAQYWVKIKLPIELTELNMKQLTVKIGLDFRYGCHSSRNPKKSSGYYALTRRYRGNGTFSIENVYIPHANTTKCRSFALWDTDHACEGCQSERDIEYRDKCLSIR